MNKKASIMLMFLIVIVAQGCSNKEPDFIGYVVAAEKDRVVVVEEGDHNPPKVLVKQSSNSFEIGTKVEVRFVEDFVADTFPYNAPAKLTEVDIPKAEKKVIRHLLTYIYNNYNVDYYTAIIKVREENDMWNIETLEYNNKPGLEEVNKRTYSVTTDPLSISILSNEGL